MERVHPAIRGVYSLVGSTDRVCARFFHFPHTQPQCRLRGHGPMAPGVHDPDRKASSRPRSPTNCSRSAPISSGPLEPEDPPEILRAFGLVRATATGRHRPFGRSLTMGGRARRGSLLTSLKVRTVCLPAAQSLDSREVRRLPLEEFTVVHTLLGRTATGEAIPVVRLTPGHPSGRLTVVAHPRGKVCWRPARVSRRRWCGRSWPAAMRSSASTRSSSAKSLDPRDPVPHRPEAVHFETYNPAAGRRADATSPRCLWCCAEEDAAARSISSPRTPPAIRPWSPGLCSRAWRVIQLAALPRSGDREVRIWPTTLDLPGLEEQFGGPSGRRRVVGTVDNNLWGLKPSWAESAYEPPCCEWNGTSRPPTRSCAIDRGE